MASTIVASTTSGLITSADNSGVLQLASGTGNLVTIPSVTGTAMVSGNMPAFSAHMGTVGTTQSVTTSTWTKVQLTAEEFDTNSNFDTSTYRFTPTVAGYYQFTGNLETGIGNATRFQCGIYKNGALFKTGYDQAATNIYKCTVSGLVYLNGTTDYVEFYGYVIGTSPTFYAGGGITSFFQGFLARSA